MPVRGYLEAGISIIVLDGDNQGLLVCAAEEVGSVEQLPEVGSVVWSSFGEKCRNRGLELQRASDTARVIGKRRVWRAGLLSGCGVGLMLAGIGPTAYWPASLIVLPVASAIVAVALMRFYFEMFFQIDGSSNLKMPLASTVMVLIAGDWPRCGLVSSTGCELAVCPD